MTRSASHPGTTRRLVHPHRRGEDLGFVHSGTQMADSPPWVWGGQFLTCCFTFVLEVSDKRDTVAERPHSKPTAREISLPLPNVGTNAAFVLKINKMRQY